MTTASIKTNIIYGLGEGALVADSTMLSYALRYANRAYRDIMSRYRFKCIRKRTIFRTTNGVSSYQMPSDFIGFLTLKDESGDNILDQITPEAFAREISTVQVTNETFTSDADTAVALDNVAVLQYSETVQNTDEDTTYTRDTDYTMSYYNGQITVLSTGSMSDATDHYIDYLYRETGDPTQFCLEFDSSNNQYVARVDPVPDATKIMTLVYPAGPSDLSGSVDPIWSKFEYSLECGGIYFGSMELVDDAQKRAEFKQDYEISILAMIQLDQDLLPKHDQIPVVLRKSDYTART